jgi:hypothetical protein
MTMMLRCRTAAGLLITPGAGHHHLVLKIKNTNDGTGVEGNLTDGEENKSEAVFITVSFVCIP